MPGKTWVYSTCRKCGKWKAVKSKLRLCAAYSQPNAQLSWMGIACAHHKPAMVSVLLGLLLDEYGTLITYPFWSNIQQRIPPIHGHIRNRSTGGPHRGEAAGNPLPFHQNRLAPPQGPSL